VTRRADLALVVAAVLGLLAVAAGAMGAHALKDRLAGQPLEWWRTAAQYAQIHAVLAVAVALAIPRPRPALVRTALVAWPAGIVIFAGTLQAMALGAPRWLGAVTPLGGTCLLVGWLALALHGARRRTHVAADHSRTGPD